MNDSIEARLEALGLALPATEGESYYGAAYGTMKPFHITGAVLHLSGHVPVRNGVPLYPGRLGETVSIEQGIEAAQWTAMNALAGMKQALGEGNRTERLRGQDQPRIHGQRVPADRYRLRTNRDVVPVRISSRDE